MTRPGPEPQTPAPTRGRARRPPWPGLVVGLVPFIAICCTVSLWDRIYPRVLGLPFNLFWLILWILLTPLCMAVAYRCEQGSPQEAPRGRCAGRKEDQP